MVIYDDPEANKKYLTLDQLGLVLKHLSEQLPGICVQWAVKINYYSHVNDFV